MEYEDSDFDQASVSIHIQSRFNNRIWIDCTPSCTYHLEGFDLSIVTDTLYQMLQDGILELIPYVE